MRGRLRATVREVIERGKPRRRQNDAIERTAKAGRTAAIFSPKNAASRPMVEVAGDRIENDEIRRLYSAPFSRSAPEQHPAARPCSFASCIGGHGASP